MNYGLILAGGVGQRMRMSGKPKQFLEVFNKPIVIYTMEKFDACVDIDAILLVCHPEWMEYMHSLLQKYTIRKTVMTAEGGTDRQKSIQNGLAFLLDQGASDDDIVVIHDAVRPLVDPAIITENIHMAKETGCCMTVKAVSESVVITNLDRARFEDIKKRDDTYSLTAPQTFRLSILRETFRDIDEADSPIPLLDMALSYTFLGNEISLIKENNNNIKVTTPRDYYMLKAMMELEENRSVFGL